MRLLSLLCGFCLGINAFAATVTLTLERGWSEPVTASFNIPKGAKAWTAQIGPQTDFRVAAIRLLAGLDWRELKPKTETGTKAPAVLGIFQLPPDWVKYQNNEVWPVLSIAVYNT